MWNSLFGDGPLALTGAFPPHPDRALSADGTRFVEETDGVLNVWDTQTGKHVVALKGRVEELMSLAFSRDGKRIAAVSNGMVKVWDAQSGRETLTSKEERHTPNTVVFSPDGQRLLTGTQEASVKVWDAHTGKEIQSLQGHTNRVGSLAFSADGQRLVSAARDRTIKIWDAQSGELLATFTGHAGRRIQAAFSPDGQRLVSAAAGFDKPGEVKVWDVASGREILSLKGPPSEYLSATFSADGRRIVAATGDGTLVVWEAQTGAANKQARLTALARPDPSWHEEQAGEAAAAGQRFAAAFHLERLLRLRPNGLSSEKLLLLQAVAGQGADCRRTWSTVLAAAGQDNEKLAEAVEWGQIVPHDEASAQRMVALTRQLVAWKASGDHLALLGSAHYRAGQYAEAAARLEEALKAKPDNDPLYPQLFLALAYQRLGRPVEARRWFDEYEKLSKSQVGDWPLRAFAKLLHDEATALLLTMPRVP